MCLERTTHTPCTLNTLLQISTESSRIATNVKFAVLAHLSIPCQQQSKVVDPDNPSFASLIYSFFYIYIIELILILNLTEIPLAERYAIISQLNHNPPYISVCYLFHLSSAKIILLSFIFIYNVHPYTVLLIIHQRRHYLCRYGFLYSINNNGVLPRHLIRITKLANDLRA